ncbi:SpoIIE family protein phosphatase [Solirubrobacter sp. CPCC 204708]|uniref:SpoIIE family protein phosphatase n=1 Tax=Solirubrobacter deserti TaxID=2282478 RepID=A0ABT4RSK8_9ACTN|nr:GAF domain-containing SpoIIE family protein phosphatase [Solirubrobacter deserti]MBE2315897.1 SpoIIE family protein phosphatase [Solirubrobacter deserti]MDA0141578.1 SpoIIE family protein phosphatase [Solirubrobacter deserti]
MSEWSALELVGSTVGRVRRTLALDTAEGDPALDRLARLASRLLGAPVALVSLVDVDEQIFPGRTGVELRSTPLSHSFCKIVVAERSVVTTADAREDPRFSSNLAIRDLGVIAYAGWPLLTAAGEALGALCAMDTQPRQWSAQDVATLHDLADAAVAELEGRAARILAEQALAREAHTAATLQLALLPDALPEVPGVHIAARYAPAENLIGGDWYDAFRLPGDRVGVAIGDVVGHGIEAAATAVQLRNALRGAALEDPSPGSVMGRLNDLAHEVPLAAFSSAAYGVLDLAAATWTWARAGHLAMLMRSAAETAFEVGPEGILLAGDPVGTVYATATHVVGPGTTLVHYTDGLVERRDAWAEERTEQLRWLVEHGPDDPDPLCQSLIERMVQPGATDDVAVVAVTLTARP